MMRIRWNVRTKFGGVVVDAGLRGQASAHEHRTRGRAERAIAIGAVEHDATSSKGLYVGCLDDLAPMNWQEGGSQLVGHHDQDVRLLVGHRSFLFRRLYLAAGSRIHSFSAIISSAGASETMGHRRFNVSSL